MENFTPGPALLGGALLGLATTLLLLFTGHLAAISGITGDLLGGVRARSDVGWRVAFLVGLLAGGGVLAVAAPATLPAAVPGSASTIVLAGLLVGFGARLGSGCTSGHGICGLSRFSARSLAATGTFMAVAAATVYAVRHVLGGSAS